MSDAFSQKASKRLRAPKLKRDPASGAFEGSTALNDPAMLEQAVRWVKAINELEPLFTALGQDLESEGMAKSAKFTGLVLEALRRSMLDALSAHKDLDAVSALTKPVLRAARLSRGRP